MGTETDAVIQLLFNRCQVYLTELRVDLIIGHLRGFAEKGERVALPCTDKILSGERESPPLAKPTLSSIARYRIARPKASCQSGWTVKVAAAAV